MNMFISAVCDVIFFFVLFLHFLPFSCLIPQKDARFSLVCNALGIIQIGLRTDEDEVCHALFKAKSWGGAIFTSHPVFCIIPEVNAYVYD